jgi:hypothetical protein
MESTMIGKISRTLEIHDLQKKWNVHLVSMPYLECSNWQYYPKIDYLKISILGIFLRGYIGY